MPIKSSSCCDLLLGPGLLEADGLFWLRPLLACELEPDVACADEDGLFCANQYQSASKRMRKRCRTHILNDLYEISVIVEARSNAWIDQF